MKKYHAVLDIGTYKMVLALRLIDDEAEQRERWVYAVAKSQGLEDDGTPRNRDHLGNTIQSLLDQIESKTGVRVTEVYLAYRGGEITAVEYSHSQNCTVLNDQDIVIQDSDLAKLKESYKTYEKQEKPKNMVLIDHVIMRYFVDGKLVDDHRVFLGEYAKTISCTFLLFLAPSEVYQRLMRLFESKGITCKGTYLGLRAEGNYVYDNEGQPYMFALAHLGYSHSELAFYEDGLMVKYFYFADGWSKAQPTLKRENYGLSPEYLRESVREVDLREARDGLRFDPGRFVDGFLHDKEGFGESDVEFQGARNQGGKRIFADKIAKKLNEVYLSSIITTLKKESIDLNLKKEDEGIEKMYLADLLAIGENKGLFFSGGLAQIRGLVDCFNTLRREKDLEVLYKSRLISCVLNALKDIDEGGEVDVLKEAVIEAVKTGKTDNNEIREAIRRVKDEVDEWYLENKESWESVSYNVNLSPVTRPELTSCEKEYEDEGIYSLLTALKTLELMERENVPMSTLEESKPVEVAAPVTPEKEAEQSVAEAEAKPRKKRWSLEWIREKVKKKSEGNKFLEKFFEDNTSTYDESSQEGQ